MSDIIELDGQTFALGRHYAEDVRDGNFPMRAAVTEKWPKNDTKFWWPSGGWFNQNPEPECVEYSWHHLMVDGPITQTKQQKKHRPVVDVDIRDRTTKGMLWVAGKLYDRAQEIDEWAGTNYDGTSIRAGAKTLVEWGYITTFLWAWDIDTVIKCILTKSPVIAGINWHRDMFYPDKKTGEITPTGILDGGHAVKLDGVNLRSGMVRGKNSYGRRWGRKGFFYISIPNLESLLKANGDFCMPSEQKIEELATV